MGKQGWRQVLACPGKLLLGPWPVESSGVVFFPPLITDGNHTMKILRREEGEVQGPAVCPGDHVSSRPALPCIYLPAHELLRICAQCLASSTAFGDGYSGLHPSARWGNRGLEKLKELVTLQPWAALLGNKHFSTLYSLPHNLPTGPQGQQRNHQALVYYLKVSKKLKASTSLWSGPLTHPLPSSSL